MDGKNIPNHVAIIPDGNRRWAKKHGKVSWQGHLEGAKRVEEVASTALAGGVKYFTIWAGSEANLTKRSKVEVAVLVRLVVATLKRLEKSKDIVRNQVRVRVIGRSVQLLKSDKLAQAITSVEKKTGGYDKHHFTILFGYDGQSDMERAVNKLIKNGGSVSREDISSALSTGELPPVDLVIRTGGEPHNSAGFMMWQAAESQLYFTEKYWPEFTSAEFSKALSEYARRERRLGK